MGELSYKQFVVLQSICLLSSSLSILGSSLIITSIFRQQTQKNHLRKNTLHQLLLGLSVSDIICTLALMTATVTNPKKSVDAMPWALGNQVTCSFSAFLYMLSATAANLYNMFMSIHFWRKVKTSKKGAVESQSTKQKDRWFRIGAHFIAILIPLLFSIAGIITNSYHPHKFIGICFYGGLNGKLIGRVRTAVMSIIALTSITVTIMLTLHVWRNIDRSNKYSLKRQVSGPLTVQKVQSSEINVTSGVFSIQTKAQDTPNTKNNKQRAVAEQAVFYMLAYLNSFLFLLAAAIVVNVTDAIENPGNPGPFAVLVLLWITQPLQGALNFIIFIRPRYKAWKTYFEKQQQRDSESSPELPPLPAVLKKAILEQAPSFRQPQPGGHRPPHYRCTNALQNSSLRLQPIPCAFEESVSVTASASCSRGVETTLPKDVDLRNSNNVDGRGKEGGLQSDKEVSFRDTDDVSYNA